jgi:hypothetical protein
MAQWLLQEAITACDMYLTAGLSQQAAALFAPSRMRATGYYLTAE